MPGHEDRADPPRPVLGRRRRRPQGAPSARRATAGADRLVLDLRGNPGGYVNEADAVASQFLKSGIVFIERGADGKETKHRGPAGRARHGPAAGRPRRRRDGQLVRDRVRARSRTPAGPRSSGSRRIGTGTVLGEFPLSDGSALRVGTVEWLTPEGRRIWHEGITPDVVVERASDVAPLDPDEVGKMTAAAGRRADRPAARPRR